MMAQRKPVATTEGSTEDAPGVTRVAVDRIHYYGKNPRRQQNPEYDRIKASIRDGGLDQPLVLTQQPGMADYVLHSGGNTRLRILKELYEETANERYYWVECVIRPWSQESSVLFAHLRENELRGGLPFIDKAHAVFEAKSLLEAELGTDGLSQRQLEALFRERGFSLSHSTISKMGYAVHTLWPVMPQALNAGLGRPQIEKIRSLERAARQLWIQRELGDENEFNAIFAELCRRYDCAEWDVQPLYTALQHEIAVAAEQSEHVIQLEIESCMAGRTVEHGLVPVEEPESVQPRTRSASGNASAAEAESPIATASSVPTATQGQKAQGAVDDEGSNATPTRSLSKSSRTPSKPDAMDIEELRSRISTTATRLAEHHGLGGQIMVLADIGMGFLLTDVPPSELTETLDQEMLGLVSALWWQLAACAEVTAAPADVVLAFLEEPSILRQALASHDADLLFSSVWTLDPGQLGCQLWQQLNPEDWQLLLQMMEAYRALKRLANERNHDLWDAGER